MTRPGPRPDPSTAVAVLLQLQDRNFSSSVAKERLSKSFAFDSFVRKQASVGESKKRKKTQVDFSRGVRSQPSNYAVYAPGPNVFFLHLFDHQSGRIDLAQASLRSREV